MQQQHGATPGLTRREPAGDLAARGHGDAHRLGVEPRRRVARGAQRGAGHRIAEGQRGTGAGQQAAAGRDGHERAAAHGSAQPGARLVAGRVSTVGKLTGSVRGKSRLKCRPRLSWRVSAERTMSSAQTTRLRSSSRSRVTRKCA